MSYDYKISDLKYRINGLVPKEVCEYFIKVFEENPDFIEKENSYKFKSNRSEQDDYLALNLSNSTLKDKKFKVVLNRALFYINIMMQNYVLYIKNGISPDFSDVFFKHTNAVRILKYNTGAFIKDHSDSGHDHVDVAGTLTRGSCTLNLNEDYEGGTFKFFNGQIKEDFKTGDAMFFPADTFWLHGTEPVTKGTRYCINCFLHA